MEPIFPQYAFGSVNLPVWQNNVIRFLSDHRKYRVLWWEFGPTLLDHLHRVKEGKLPDYTKNGLILTYSIASIVTLVSFASTRRAVFTAAVTSGVILLGMVTTVAIDYHRTKRQNNGEVRGQEYYFELLTLLGETPQYWWWPWSRKIKDIKVTERQKDRAINYNDYSFTARLFYSLFTNVISHQFYATRCGYLYNYQKLGGKMPFVFNWSWQAKQPIYDTENKLEIKSNNLVRKFLNVDSESNTTLKKALTTLQFGWLLHHLDESLKGVQMGTKTKKEHDQYCKRLITETQKLSLIYHSDKKTNKQEGVDADAEQKLINETIQALRNVHKYVITKHKGVYNEYYGIYRLYGELSMNALNDDKKDIFSMVKISPFDGRSVLLDSLGVLASYEEGELMSSRNGYIKKAKEIVKCYQDILELLRKCKGENIYIFAKKKKEEFDQRRNSERHRYLIDWVHEVNIDLETDKGLEVIKKVIDAQEKAFNQYEKDYLRSYNDYWVKQLEGLSRNCQEDKELEVIKKEVEELYNESKKQQEILIGKGNGVANDLFVQPILSYKALVKVCYKFVVGLYNDIKKNEISLDDLRYVFYETGPDSKFVKESKEGIEKLSEMELSNFLSEMVNNYYPGDGIFTIKSSSRKKVKEMMSCFTDEGGNNTETIHLIAFMLRRIEKRFDDKFKKQETYFDRREKEEKEGKTESEKLGKTLEEAEQRAKQETQRAEQETQRAEQIKIISRVFTKKMFKLNDEELRDVVTDSHGKIVEEIVGHVMKHNSSPEQVLDAIIEEVISNRDQVMREGAVGDELINKALEEMNETEVDLSTFFQDVDVSQDATAKIQK